GGTELPEGLGAVDPRELQVHQDEVGSELGREPDAVLARGRLDHLVAGIGQHVANQLEVLGVVLDHEDAALAHRTSWCSSPDPGSRTGAPTVASALNRSSRPI